MKNVFYLIAFGLIIISCQKEIDVDLNEADPKIVIEANYTAEDSTVRVQITKSTNYFSLTAAPTIDNAIVTITDVNGVESTITSIGAGGYELISYAPIFNTTYTMKVVIDGVEYIAQCDMKSPVQLEDMTFDFYPGFFGSSEGYASNLRFYDPADTTNFYIVVLGKNGVISDSLQNFILQDDQLTDGNLVERPLFVNPLYNAGDVIDMELRSLDSRMFYYYAEIQSIGGASAAPANPENNWSNNILGYFNAYSNSRKQGIVP